MGGGGWVRYSVYVCIVSTCTVVFYMAVCVCWRVREVVVVYLPSCLPANVCLELCERWKRLKTTE